MSKMLIQVLCITEATFKKKKKKRALITRFQIFQDRLVLAKWQTNRPKEQKTGSRNTSTYSWSTGFPQTLQGSQSVGKGRAFQHMVLEQSKIALKKDMGLEPTLGTIFLKTSISVNPATLTPLEEYRGRIHWGRHKNNVSKHTRRCSTWVGECKLTSHWAIVTTVLGWQTLFKPEIPPPHTH